MDNKQRAHSAVRALQTVEDYAELHDETGPNRTPMVDLLANLRHLCNRDGLDFDDVSRISETHYTAEINGDE